MPSRSRWLSLALVLSLFFYILLLSGFPLADALANLESQSELFGTVARNKKWVALGAMGLGLAFGAWVIWRRKWAYLVVGAVGMVFLAATYGVYKFQKTYPRAGLLNTERYQDSLSILLGRDAALSRFAPQDTLKVERRRIERAAFPVIDVHFHLESLRYDMTPDRLVAAMDAAGVQKVVHLGGDQPTFEHFAKKFRDKHPDRFILFVKPDPNALMRPNGVQEEVAWLRKAARMGAQGIKENKSFGMGQLDEQGRNVPIDDPRLDPYWSLAAQLRMPVLFHIGEPTSFWRPVDPTNERYPELLRHPEWSLDSKGVPTQGSLMAQRERLVARHPGTVFIGAHLGMNADDLAYAARLLDTYPNYFLDIAAVISDLGRQPYTARRFFIKYQDRILFGSDGGFGLSSRTDWTPERLFRSYFEFLETENEYTEYPLQSITRQGDWRVHGLGLPSEVLEKLYFRNAARLIPPSADVISRLDALDPGS